MNERKGRFWKAAEHPRMDINKHARFVPFTPVDLIGVCLQCALSLCKGNRRSLTVALSFFATSAGASSTCCSSKLLTQNNLVFSQHLQQLHKELHRTSS